MKPLLLLLLLPSVVWAQYKVPVEPVLSKDYINLTRNNRDTLKNNSRIDSTNNIYTSTVRLTKNFRMDIPVKRIKTDAKGVTIYNNAPLHVALTGNYSSTVEIKTANRQPALQNEFVQGSSQNGALTWRGPETDEVFSYGPSIHSLEFDGSNYPYDINGKLVANGSGNGNNVIAYNNSILRTIALFTQNLSLRASFTRSYIKKWTFNTKLGKTIEPTIIKNNKNNSNSLFVSVVRTTNKLTITGSYDHLQDKFSNSNRNGFLNRVYQSALLTPISFSNYQGTTLSNNSQRSYSSYADNPLFLLENNGNHFSQSKHTGILALEGNLRPVKVKLIQSVENLRQSSAEGYKAGTAFFQNGIATERKKNDLSYFLKANLTAPVHYKNYNFSSTTTLNYIFTDAHSKTGYSIDHSAYRYQRTSHDYSFGYLTAYDGDVLNGGLDLGNKFYFSNTSRKDSWLLPYAGAYIKLEHVAEGFDIKLVSVFNRSASELSINRSLAHVNLLHYSVQESLQYFPLAEVSGYNGLLPIIHQDLSGTIELSYKNNLYLSAELFNRKTYHDIFPVYENAGLELKNIAGYRKKGIELLLSAYRLPFNSKTLFISSTLSFTNWRNKVTQVEEGYDLTPIAGFSDINRSIVKGQPLGVILGNSYLRDAQNNIVIGADGFPLVNTQPTVIGDPTPDFFMKLGNTISWKFFTLLIDMEWKKGGDIWNGTQAALDYYGRSKNSALLRGTTNYVFTGVMQDGHANTIPVNFYDPGLPVDKNRWVRYGIGGIAEEYIQKANSLRFNTLSLAYRKPFKKHIQQLTVTAYINNLILWTAYKGSDSNQLLYDQQNTSGLDFFNLPSVKTFGFNLSIQF